MDNDMSVLLILQQNLLTITNSYDQRCGQIWTPSQLYVKHMTMVLLSS